MRQMSKTGWILVAAVVLAAAAGAQDSLDSLVAEHTHGDVAWRTGGVGHDERAALERVSPQYNLKLIFAEKGTLAFVADVTVRIATPAGETILEAPADGPWFLARLPAGSYEVTATAAGKPQSQKAEVPASGQAELRFYW